MCARLLTQPHVPSLSVSLSTNNLYKYFITTYIKCVVKYNTYMYILLLYICILFFCLVALLCQLSVHKSRKMPTLCNCQQKVDSLSTLLVAVTVCSKSL